MRNWPAISLPIGSVQIGLSKSGIAVLRTGGWRKRITVLADVPLADTVLGTPERLEIQCRTLLSDNAKIKACRGLPLCVTLADDWARLFMVTPPQNCARLDDCKAAATMRFQALYGRNMDDWQIEGSWDARHPFLACALPRPLFSTLQQIALENQLHLVDIAPQFVRLWNHWRKNLQPESWFGIAQNRTLTVAAVAQRRLCAVRTSTIPVEHAGSWLQQHVTREALRLNLPLPKQLQLCGGQADLWSETSAGSSAEVIKVSNLDAPTIKNVNAVSEYTLTPNVTLARGGIGS